MTSLVNANSRIVPCTMEDMCRRCSSGWRYIELLPALTFEYHVRVPRFALEVAEKGVQVSPVDIIFGKFTMLSRQNVLHSWSV